MYKKILKGCLLILMICLLVSCKNDKYVDYLSRTKEQEIIDKKAEKLDIPSAYIDVLYFFGGYNDAYVVFMDPAPSTSGLIETVSGVPFEYTTERKMEVYYEGTFYSLTEAFNKEILSSANIVKIKENFENKENLGLTEKLKEEGLTKDNFDDIVEVYPYLMIDKYLGTYNDTHVVWFEEMRNNLGMVNYVDVSGMLYDQKDYEGIIVINDKQSYSLLDAKNRNLLSYDDLTKVFNKFYGYNIDEFIYENNKLALQARFNILVDYYNKYMIEREKDFKLAWMFTLELLFEKNGVFVLYTVPELNSNIVVDDLVFPSEIEIIVYKENNVYDLQTAYDANIISKENVLEIYNSFK